MEEIEEEPCYICLEDTEERSPCSCSQPVHSKCLHHAQKYNDTCTICRKEFDNVDKPRHSANALLLYLFILRNIIRILIFVAGYLVMGITGQLFLAASGYKTVLLSNASRWTACVSLEFLACAMVMTFLCTACYILMRTLEIL